MKTFISSGPNKTKAAGRYLGEIIRLEKINNQPLVIALSGDLGSGKTTFIKGLLRGLGVRGRVVSPTFTIYRRFPIKQNAVSGNFRNIFHIDAYRLNKQETIVSSLGNFFADPQNILIVEWADRIKKILPKDAIWLIFRHGGKINERIIEIKIKN